MAFNRMSVQKRQRERKKAEQAEQKRAARRRSTSTEQPSGGQVADRSELEGYGVVPTFTEPQSQ